MTATLAAVRNDAADAVTGARRTVALPSPAEKRAAMPVSPALSARIARQRAAIRDVLAGRDDRLLVITGPCSLHDRAAALDYGRRLAALAEALDERLLIVMRAYVEKPRTTIGWKGLLHDPSLDGRGDLDAGLSTARQLLLDLGALGLPLATELLSPMAAPYIEDTLAWAAIGARTAESQTHRELVSGLDLPVGFKNATDGHLATALDAMGAAAHAHTQFGTDDDGRAALVTTTGNPDTHLILRGGRAGANYDERTVSAARARLAEAGFAPRLLVDCSHANSGKDPQRQPAVARELARRRAAGESAIAGLMLESHLETGKQPIGPSMRYGISITDGCLGWAETRDLLHELAAS